MAYNNSKLLLFIVINKTLFAINNIQIAISVNGSVKYVNSNLSPVNGNLGPVNGNLCPLKNQQFAVIIGNFLFLDKYRKLLFFLLSV